MERTAKAILAFLLMFNPPVFAEVTVLHKGQMAPIDGFLFDHDSEAEAEKDRTDAVFYKALSDKQMEAIKLEDNENQILEKRLQLYINESNTLAKDRANSNFNEKLLLFGSFSLGVIVTALIVRNVRN